MGYYYLHIAEVDLRGSFTLTMTVPFSPVC